MLPAKKEANVIIYTVNVVTHDETNVVVISQGSQHRPCLFGVKIAEKLRVQVISIINETEICKP
jgi:hypothetical protein